MDIREYMFRNRLTNKKMAEILDCSLPQIGLIRRGAKVSHKFARQVQKATNGMVSIEEICTLIPPPMPGDQPMLENEGGKAA